MQGLSINYKCENCDGDILCWVFVKMASQTGQDWQSKKTSIQERNAYMFNNADMSDIQLACGKTKRDVFYAHKYVLATSSPVFHRMFYGSLPETGPVIHLPDTDKESLEAFLRYLYTDETPGTAELALKVMYLAHKYMITALTKECVNIVKPKVSTENAFLVIRYAMLVDEETLIETAWQVVDSRTREVIKSENFGDIDGRQLGDFLKRDSLRITEVELFRAVFKWTESKCKEREMKVTEENRRSVLGDAIYHLRFLAMSQDEFLQEVIPTRLLNSEDTLSILQKFLGHDPDSLKWPITKKRSDYLRLARFDAKYAKAPSAIWRYLFGLVWYIFPAISRYYSRGAMDYVRFSIVNLEVKTVRSGRKACKQEEVMFWGVRLLGDAYGSTYHVTMTTEDDENYSKKSYRKADVSGSYTSEFLTGNTYGFDVLLKKPLKIQLKSKMEKSYRYSGYPRSYTLESILYTVKITVKGPSLYSACSVLSKNTVNICEHRQVKLDSSIYNKGLIWQLLLMPCQPCAPCMSTTTTNANVSCGQPDSEMTRTCF